MSSAELTLWARIEDLERGLVQRALWEDRSLFKTWAMRGTLHLLPSTEAGMWLAALGTYDHYLKPAWLKAFDMTRDELDVLIDAVGRALEGRELTRKELAEEVVRLTGTARLEHKLVESWGAFLKPPSFRGLLCFAPSVGQNVRFTRPDSWLGGIEPADPKESLSEVARRFIGAYGPVTREDLARWWGTGPAPARRLIEGLGEVVAPVEVDGVAGWMLAAHVVDARDYAPPKVVRLLPAFDQYVVGAPRKDLAPLRAHLRERVYRKAGWISQVLLVDGRIDGVWRHKVKGKRLLVDVEPFEKRPGWVRRQAAEEAERLGAFLGAAVDDVTWASP